MRALATCLLFLALSPALGASAASSYMIGTWFGYGQPEDKDSMYIDRMRSDGSWRGEYRTCVKGRSVDQVQTGRWSLNGNMLSLRVEAVNGVAAPRTDLYKMLSHGSRMQKYVSMAWNFAYTPKRVADDFQMPSCALVS